MAIDTQSAADCAPAAAGLEQRSGVPRRLRDGTPVWLRTVDPASPVEEHAAIVAEEAAGHAVGRVAYRRVYGPRADLTLAVDDELWPCGLAELLIAGIGPIAAVGGISRFLVRVAVFDERLLALLAGELGTRWRREGSYVDVELAVWALPPAYVRIQPHAATPPSHDPATLAGKPATHA